ncbi:Erg28 like protein-domain-containing protein [Crassisporium funariophilum]|nr:Erg28 like protein-domain-containing protein [Crassisporium funariophilum]
MTWTTLSFNTRYAAPMFSSLAAYLPTSAGWLASWQLLVATTAVFNFVQNFVTLKFTRKIYDNVPSHTVTALQARTFAVWTLTSAVIRGYAAYNINNKIMYDMAFMSYLIAFGHFSSELLIFRSCKVNAGVMSPVIVSTTSLIWMFVQYDYYVRS